MKKVFLTLGLVISIAIIGFSAPADSTQVKKDTAKVAKKAVTYKVITGKDTTLVVRGDSIHAEFSATDKLTPMDPWLNKETKKEESKMSANGEIFYLQEGYKSTTLANGNVAIDGLAGDSLPWYMQVGGIVLACLGLGLIFRKPIMGLF